MSNALQKPRDGGGNRHRNGRSPTVAATVLILWENFATASAARNACREMEEAGQLRIGRESMWKFDLLHMPRFCEDAAREAAEADWVIVAFENNLAPSPELQHWLDSWRASASGKPQSLVALCVPPPIPDTEGGLLRELRTFARRVGCTFHEPPGGASFASGSERTS